MDHIEQEEVGRILNHAHWMTVQKAAQGMMARISGLLPIVVMMIQAMTIHQEDTLNQRKKHAVSSGAGGRFKKVRTAFSIPASSDGSRGMGGPPPARRSHIRP
jgi:hypothetical protein